jgi:hypothetical protein
MDREAAKVTAEVAAIRGKGWVRLLVRLAGLAAVIVAALNFFGVETWTAYRTWLATAGGVEPTVGITYLADFLLVLGGAAVANFV